MAHCLLEHVVHANSPLQVHMHLSLGARSKAYTGMQWIMSLKGFGMHSEYRAVFEVASYAQSSLVKQLTALTCNLWSVWTCGNKMPGSHVHWDSINGKCSGKFLPNLKIIVRSHLCITWPHVYLLFLLQIYTVFGPLSITVAFV